MAYGVQEVNPLMVNGHEYHARFNREKAVDWTTPGLKVTRLRLLSDPGFPFWDVSYCHGSLNGKDVCVSLPFSQLPKKNMKGAILQYAKEDGVFAKKVGVFDAISTLI